MTVRRERLRVEERDIDFHIPALELTNFAVDARYKKNHAAEYAEVSIGEYIFFSFIVPLAKAVSKLCGCRDIFVFALNTPKLLHYYQSKLGFKYIEDLTDLIELPVSGYSKNLVFMYQPLQGLDFPLSEIVFN